MDKKQTIYEDIISYMERKYSDNFTYSSPFGGGAGANSKQAILKSEKYPEYDIWVEYSYDTSEYRDNYTDYKLKNQCEDYLKTKFEKAFNGKVNVIRNIPTRGCYAQYNDIDLKGYLNTPEQNIGFSAVVKYSQYSNREEVEKLVSDIFNENKASIYGAIYFVENEDDCDAFFEQSLSEQQAYPYVYAKKIKSNITDFEWR